MPFLFSMQAEDLLSTLESHDETIKECSRQLSPLVHSIPNTHPTKYMLFRNPLLHHSGDHEMAACAHARSIAEIASYLDEFQALSLLMISRRWNNALASSQWVWKLIYEQHDHPPEPPIQNYRLSVIAHARMIWQQARGVEGTTNRRTHGMTLYATE